SRSSAVSGSAGSTSPASSASTSSPSTTSASLGAGALGFFGIRTGQYSHGIFLAVECAPMPIVHHAIDVAAPPDQCCRIFSDLGSWPHWFPFLGRVDSELRAGGRLTLHLAAGAGRLQVPVTIEELEPSRRVRWVGGRMGIRGDHFYDFAVNIP